MREWAAMCNTAATVDALRLDYTRWSPHSATGASNRSLVESGSNARCCETAGSKLAWGWSGREGARILAFVSPTHGPVKVKQAHKNESPEFGTS